DIELKEPRNKELVRFGNEIEADTNIIVSYHNFKRTPNYNKLLEIVNKELQIGDISKFATMVNSKKDILTVLSVIEEFKGKVIGIGMGEKGKLTRILGTYFGSILTFASMEGKSSAPGQIDMKKLREIYSLIF
ncbi:MAG TPA: type I 3-dehydroquinate dehydratase, partial [Methanothermococcus okinawensis]|nr:type I 3-dehydroquinate dehydratase [Methanothermococcus okinawensis]